MTKQSNDSSLDFLKVDHTSIRKSHKEDKPAHRQGNDAADHHRTVQERGIRAGNTESVDDDVINKDLQDVIAKYWKGRQKPGFIGYKATGEEDEEEEVHIKDDFVPPEGKHGERIFRESEPEPEENIVEAEEPEIPEPEENIIETEKPKVPEPEEIIIEAEESEVPKPEESIIEAEKSESEEEPESEEESAGYEAEEEVTESEIGLEEEEPSESEIGLEEEASESEIRIEEEEAPESELKTEEEESTETESKEQIINDDSGDEEETEDIVPKTEELKAIPEQSVELPEEEPVIPEQSVESPEKESVEMPEASANESEEATEEETVAEEPAISIPLHINPPSSQKPAEEEPEKSEKDKESQPAPAVVPAVAAAATIVAAAAATTAGATVATAATTAATTAVTTASATSATAAATTKAAISKEQKAAADTDQKGATATEQKATNPGSPTSRRTTGRRTEAKKTHKKKKKKKKGFGRFIKGFFIFLLIFILAGSMTFGIMRYRGWKNSNRTNDSGEELGWLEDAVSEDGGKTIVYKGVTYYFNENLSTILFIGVDKEEYTDDGVSGEAGQADTVFLTTFNHRTGETRMIPISRNTMVAVDQYNTDGTYWKQENVQLAVSYAYGTNKDESCKNVAKAVSRILYGMPVHKYVTMDISAITQLNDAVGGVDVTIPEDMTNVNPEWVKGATVHLEGKQAEKYVRTRKTTISKEGQDNNAPRMERQKIYLDSFIHTLLRKMRGNVLLPLKLYREVGDDIYSDITPSEIVYYATMILSKGFNNSILSIEGKVKQGEYTEFYPKEEQLYQLILDTFYERQ